jgi:glycosyltransferase involved in cell wall biosynthesis
VDRFIAPSRFTQQQHESRGAELPFTHLPYFVPYPEAPAAPIRRERPYLLFVGRLERIKGVHTLFPAMRQLPELDLLVVGDGAEEDALRREGAGLLNVHFLGRKPYQELRSLYAGALATLVPSICYEVFGIVILESLVEGTPVIVRDRGALPEAARDTGGGVAYQTEDELIEAIRRFASDTAARASFGRAGQQAVRERFSEAPHLDAYLDLCAEIAEHRA